MCEKLSEKRTWDPLICLRCWLHFFYERKLSQSRICEIYLSVTHASNSEGILHYYYYYYYYYYIVSVCVEWPTRIMSYIGIC